MNVADEGNEGEVQGEDSNPTIPITIEDTDGNPTAKKIKLEE